MSNIALILFFSFGAILTFYLIFGSHRHLLLRLAFLAGFAIVSSAIFFSFESFKGWPAEEFPEVGYVHKIMVDIVNEKIYVLMVPDETPKPWYNLVLYSQDKNIPRLFLYPDYSDELAEKFKKAAEQMRDGYVVEFRLQTQYRSSGDGEFQGDFAPELIVTPPNEVLTK